MRWPAHQYGIYEEYYRALMVVGADGKCAGIGDYDVAGYGARHATEALYSGGQ